MSAPLSCVEFQEACAAWALGALEPEEVTAMEEHLRRDGDHAACRAALAQARAAAGAVPSSLAPVAPSPAVWQKIEAELGLPARRPRARVLAVLPWVVAAACAALALWFARDLGRTQDELGRTQDELGRARALVTQATRDEARLRVQLRESAAALAALRSEMVMGAEALALAGQPGSRVVELAPQGDTPARAAAVFHHDTRRAIILAHGVAPPAGKDFELWVIKGEHKHPAGLLRAGERGMAIAARIDPKLLEGGADAFAVTLEKTGGVPSPEGPVVLVASLR